MEEFQYVTVCMKRLRLLKFHHLVRLWILLISVGMIFRAPAYTTNDVNTIFNSYLNSFYVLNGENAWFRNAQNSGNNPRDATFFWEQAEEIECVIDAYEWTSNSTYKVMVINLLNGFIANNGTSWTAVDGFNDDVMWAVLAFARGGSDTGNTNFCNIAEFNFNACFARAWSTNLGGGMYWEYPNNASKNACVNGPGAIAAYLLYRIYGNTNYWNDATNIYYWERSILFNTGTGAVYDNINTNGIIYEASTTYNQGTFLGAANCLGQISDAQLAANYTMNDMTIDGILPQYGIANNNSGFNAIFIRWMAKFIEVNAMQSTYQTWLQNNANAAWNFRRTADNLSWCQWLQPTPTGTNLYSWDCISSVEAMIAVPGTQSTFPGAATDVRFEQQLGK